MLCQNMLYGSNVFKYVIVCGVWVCGCGCGWYHIIKSRSDNRPSGARFTRKAKPRFQYGKLITHTQTGKGAIKLLVHSPTSLAPPLAFANSYFTHIL